MLPYQHYERVATPEPSGRPAATSPLAIALAGLQLSRKGLFCERARAFGLRILSTGDYVRQECRARNLPLNARSTEAVAQELSIAEGQILARTLDEIDKELCPLGLVVDSVKSPLEVELLRQRFHKVVTVALLAAPSVRWAASQDRSRADDHGDLRTFRARDVRELGLGLGNVMALADHFVLAGATHETVRQIDQLLRNLTGISPPRRE